MVHLSRLVQLAITVNNSNRHKDNDLVPFSIDVGYFLHEQSNSIIIDRSAVSKSILHRFL